MTEINITTDEEAFFHITSSLIKQNEKSIGIGEECAYRGFSSESMSELSKRLFGTAKHSDLNEDQKDLFNESLYELINPDIKCAIGHIIDDDSYDTSIEGESIKSDYVIHIVEQSNPQWELTGKTLEMLEKLQVTHDTVMPSYWEDVFSKFKFDNYGGYLYSSESK